MKTSAEKKDEFFEKIEKEKISLPELRKEEKEIKKELFQKIEVEKKEEKKDREVKKEETIKKELEFLKDPSLQKKIIALLKIAQKKGILYSIQLVKKTKDPLLLDLYHDFLVKEGFFKKFFFK